MPKAEFYEKILNFVRKEDPRTWWREYPPKFTYKDKILPAETVKKHLREIFSHKNRLPIGVYLNIPFCRSRCLFCKFYSEIPRGKEEIDDYLDCLEKELELYGVNFKKTPLDNLYIGGGTPTILNHKQWKKLFKIIHKFFIFKKNAQILTEGTPETSTYEKLKLLKNLGVNRFTIGVQSFDDEVLEKANRPHSVQDIYRAFKNVRRAGIQYINFDILLGLVGERWDSYIHTLQGIVDLKPDCVSFMTLDLGRGVNDLYGKEAEKSYFFKESLKPKIFSFLNYILDKAGYGKATGFSDSTFVLSGRENSVNRNLLNRNKLNYVFGAGSGGESYLGPLKYYNPPNNREYLLNIKTANLPRFVGIKLGQDEYRRRYFIYNFVFRGKINRIEFRKQFNEDLTQVIDKKFRESKNDKKLFDAGDDLIFLPSSETIRRVGKYSGKNYGNQERSFLFCLKYFYSPRIINQCKKYLKYHEYRKNRL